ncbi:hypothetical protein QKU48_gp0996 [Fadolivirus algeromassiliense]|jgi:hypothetical protein|uniref:Uncharacterized protein n=1 Tax=Fadolivirus FV1/VV64 TaxID=3070911 RepID=A0A7D3UVY1_9VIRU|nr:hypothetical protein QKU48_gp0996 [Fadolivirus algeromassiliense]QKF94454.1 hypothetical protein Fadolivirus_1_996 [Fadolivirus FV1/VV64]
MSSTSILLNKINKHIGSIVVTSILMLYANFSQDNKIDILINMSNTFLFATIFSVICLKIFTFNINLNIIKDLIDVDDTLIWSINIIHCNWLLGFLLSGINMLVPVYRFEYIFMHLTLITFIFAIIRNLIYISVYGKSFDIPSTGNNDFNTFVEDGIIYYQIREKLKQD